MPMYASVVETISILHGFSRWQQASEEASCKSSEVVRTPWAEKIRAQFQNHRLSARPSSRR